MPGARKAILCGALAAASVLLGACGGAASRLASHMQRGEAYYQQEDFTKASIEFRNAMQIAPTDVKARLMGGRTMERLGRLREAAGLYQSVIDTNPDNAEARASLGRVLLVGGAADRVKALVEPGLAKHPNDAELLTVRAAARLELKDEPGAVVDVERALQIEPANVDAVALRAGMYRNAGDPEDLKKATALVSDTLVRVPDSLELRGLLADLWNAAGNATKVEEQLRELVRLRPKEFRYRYQLALFYSRAKKTDDAQRVLEEAVRVMPGDDNARLSLVSFLSANRGAARAEEALRSFIAREPSDYSLRLGLAALLQSSGASNKALDEYREIIRLDGTGSSGLIARDRIAAFDAAQGRDADARKLLDQVLQMNPHDNDALGLRAQLAMAHNEPAAAIADLRAVLKGEPQSLGVRRALAHAYLASGEPALAEEALRAAMDLAPKDMGVRIELAQLLVQIQRGEQAVALLNQAVHDAPTDPAVREALARAYLTQKDYPAARATAEDLKVLRPQAAAGSYLAGLVAQEQNRLDDAQREFEHALVLQPQAADALSALAHLELSRGQRERAIAVVRDAAARAPSSAFPLNLLGEIYLSMDRSKTPLAIDVLTRATQLAPAWWPAYHNLAIARYVTGDVDGAVATYTAAIKAIPSEPGPVVELALLYEEKGRGDEAIATYEASYKRNPHQPVVANNLAMLLATYKSDRASLDRARDLVAAFASSDDASLLDTRGWVTFKRGEYAEALPVLQRAAQRAPDSRVIRYHLGMAELRRGELVRARSDLETALAGSARFAGADEARVALGSLKNPTG